MTTTLHRLEPVTPSGRANGRAADFPPLAPSSTQPRRPTGDPWDVRTVRRVMWWLRLPFRVVWALTWEADTTYPQARSFVVAHIRGMVGRETRKARLESCRGSYESKEIACPHLVQSRGRDYCGRCGCGNHPAARLTWKTRLKAATCPAGRWEK